jgi:WD40 repeat protein
MISLLSLSMVLAAPPVTATAYSPDGKFLIAGLRGEVQLFDAETGELRSKFVTTGRVTAASWAGPRQFAVAAGEPGKSGMIQLITVGSSVSEPWKAHNDAVYALAFSPDGRWLFSAGYDRIVKRWSVADPRSPPLEMKDHSDAVYGLAVHPNGSLLASVSADRTVKIWDVESGRRLYSLGDSTDWLATVAWSPDGNSLAAAGTDKSLRVWKSDAKSGVLVKSVFAHSGPVVKLAYSADGKSIVTAGDDKLVKVWNSKSLVETVTSRPQPDSILCLSIRPDGQRIAVGRYDGQLLVMDPITGQVGGQILPIVPKPPKISTVLPAYIVRGQDVRLKVTGSALDTVRGVRGMPAAKIVSQSAHELMVEWPANASATIGPMTLALESPLGVSNDARVSVERFATISETGRPDSLSSAMTVPLDRVIVGTLDRAGDADFYRFEATAGQPIGMTVEAPKFSAVLTALGPAGEIITESTSGSLGFVAAQAGSYAVRVRDRDYRGGGDVTYRLSLGRVPVVTRVFPPAVTRGTTTAVHVAGVHLPKVGPFNVTVDTDEKAMSKDLLPLLGGDRPAGMATVRVESLPAMLAPENKANLSSTPAAADGILTRPGDELTVRFPARKGERLIVEGLARRYGSPVDPRIEVLDASGKPVPRAVLRCTAKTILTFRDHDSVKPGLRLETWNELATNDLLLVDSEIVKIQQLPGHPDADCDFFAVGGVRSAFMDTTPAHHAKDTPMYKVEVHPPGTDFPPNGMPIVRLDYVNDDGGPGYGKDARLFFTAPADGDYRIRLTDARGSGGPDHVARVTVRPPQPDVRVKVTQDKLVVPIGGTLPVFVSIDRIDGYDGPVDVRLVELPEGFSSVPGRIESGFFATTLGLTARSDAKDGKQPIKLVASTSTGITREVTIGAPTRELKPEIIATVPARSLSIQPDMEARFIVTIERKEGFKNRIPIDIRGLPHGVTVQNIGLNKIMITEKETTREVVIRAEPWVVPATFPILVVAQREGKKAEFAATPVMLTIQQPSITPNRKP